jgi:flagellar FliL protein
MLKRLLPLLLMIVLTPAALASAKKEEPAAPSEYIELKPAFVTNYGSGAIHFLKADVTLRVPDPQMTQAVLRHLPQIRHTLVMLLSRQEEQDIATMEGKEQLRQEALAAVRAVIEAEEGKPGVEDLLFTGFILQR